MTENPGFYAGKIIPQPPRHLTRAEQIELLLWHPFFTGKCPYCGQAIAPIDVSLEQWHCQICKSDGSKLSEEPDFNH